MTESTVDRLNDRSVVLALQELTEEIGAAVPEVAPDADDAAALVGALLDAAGLDPATATVVADPASAARRMLDHALHDGDTAEATGRILADPPADEQLSVEAAVTAAVVLGALVAWLQTKVDIRVSRKDGRTEFEFKLAKAATGPATIRRLAEVVAGLLTGPTPPP